MYKKRVKIIILFYVTKRVCIRGIMDAVETHGTVRLYTGKHKEYLVPQVQKLGRKHSLFHKRAAGTQLIEMTCCIPAAYQLRMKNYELQQRPLRNLCEKT